LDSRDYVASPQPGRSNGPKRRRSESRPRLSE
jgi:hypothetical protein